MTEVRPEPWDRVAVAGPYADWKEIEAAASVSIPSRISDSLGSDDGHCVLVFAEADKVVAWAMVGRENADFDPLAGKCLPRATTFRVGRSKVYSWKIVTVAPPGT